jgi:hypothetical protein
MLHRPICLVPKSSFFTKKKLQAPFQNSISMTSAADVLRSWRFPSVQCSSQLTSAWQRQVDPSNWRVWIWLPSGFRERWTKTRKKVGYSELYHVYHSFDWDITWALNPTWYNGIHL